MQPDRPDIASHGTYAGLMAHRRRKEEPCASCKRAGARYMQAWRRRDKCAPGLGWPLRHGEHDAGHNPSLTGGVA